MEQRPSRSSRISRRSCRAAASRGCNPGSRTPSRSAPATVAREAADGGCRRAPAPGSRTAGVRTGRAPTRLSRHAVWASAPITTLPIPSDRSKPIAWASVHRPRPVLGTGRSDHADCDDRHPRRRPAGATRRHAAVREALVLAPRGSRSSQEPEQFRIAEPRQLRPPPSSRRRPSPCRAGRGRRAGRGSDVCDIALLMS